MKTEIASLNKLLEASEKWDEMTRPNWPLIMPSGFDMCSSVQAIRGSVDASMAILHKVLGADFSWDITSYDGEGPAANVSHNMKVQTHRALSNCCGKALFEAVIKTRISELEKPTT